MILIEFRESMLNKAIDKVEEVKDNLKMSKMALCEVEDLLQDLYEEEHDEYDENEVNVEPSGDSYDAVVEGNDIEVNYRRRGNMRGGMRYRNNMHMRNMRRNKMGRYSY
jgi:hydroxymethylpyrimidine pyrophosphatase-like HAD family hydrolase